MGLVKLGQPVGIWNRRSIKVLPSLSLKMITNLYAYILCSAALLVGLEGGSNASELAKGKIFLH